MFYPTLHAAVKKEDVEDVLLHIASPLTDVNSRDSDQRTALHIAINVGNAEIVEVLIKSNADLSLLNKNGHTAFVLAIYKRNFEILKLLADAAGLINDQDQMNNAMKAAIFQNDASVVKFLLSLFAGVPITSILTSAAGSTQETSLLYKACFRGNVEVVKLLVDAGACAIGNNRKHMTELHLAAEKNNVELVDFLLSRNFDVDVKTEKENRTPLHLACKVNEGESHYGVMEKLLASGSDVNSRDNHGNTPFHYMLFRPSFKTIELFLKFGYDISIFNGMGQTALFSGINTRKLEIVRLLVEYGSKVDFQSPYKGYTPLHYVSLFTELDVEFTKFFVRNGANVNALDFENKTPILEKLKLVDYKSKIYSDTLKYLLKYSDVNVVSSGEENILSNLTSDGKVWKIILEHLAKLKALNLPLHPGVLKTLENNEEFNYYFNKCTQELLMAKSTKLHNSWVTFYNILVDSEKSLKNYAGNQDLVNDFYKSDINKKFRIYGTCMRKKMAKGVKRRELYDKSTVLLFSSLPIFNPTHLVIRDIVDNLSTKDLAKLNEKNKKFLLNN